jgi:hypothetical protein
MPIVTSIVLSVLVGLLAGILVHFVTKRKKPELEVCVASLSVILVVIILVVSRPPPEVAAVPSVVGMWQDEGCAVLRAAKFKPQLLPSTDPLVERGRVLDQDPMAGAQVYRETKVRVWANAVKVRIVKPARGDQVPFKTPVQGTHAGVPTDRDVWVVVTPRRCPSYLPQCKEVNKEPNGVWRGLARVGLGPASDCGDSFDILAVLADGSGSNEFKHYLESADGTSKFAGLDWLPKNAWVGDVVTVMRRAGDSDGPWPRPAPPRVQRDLTFWAAVSAIAVAIAAVVAVIGLIVSLARPSRRRQGSTNEGNNIGQLPPHQDRGKEV